MKSRFLSALFTLVVTGTLTAQPKPLTVSPDSSRQPSVPTQAFVLTPDDPIGVQTYTLSNGLTVMLSVNKSAPRIQTFIAVRAGSKNDPANNTGLAHYLEHMLFKGTDRFGTRDYAREKPLLDEIDSLYEVYGHTKDTESRKRIYHAIDSVSGVAATYAIANEYDKMVGSIGVRGSNAFTWFEQTVYEADVPTNQLDTWLTIEAERFRNPVFRIFHTELEAVYEEKNRSLDDDNDQAFDTLLATLYRNHPYGTQTTLGTVEHLKNPSLRAIRNYYRTYYVPNDMAIIMAGDFDPAQALAMIEKHFGGMKSGSIPAFSYTPETPRTKPVEITVTGPDAENVRIGFRLPGAATREAVLADLTDMLLAYKGAGLIDLNLNQQQKVLEASSSIMTMADYTTHLFSGVPRDGQSLEQVRDLLLNEIARLKRGEFDESMLKAIIRNVRADRTRSFESNSGRAYSMLDAFTLGIPWRDYNSRLRTMESVTKSELVDFINRYYGNDYVVVYKRQGEDMSVAKVEKPTITPVDMNRDAESEFLRSVLSSPTASIQPSFIDYSHDLTTLQLRPDLPIRYVHNQENDLFSLYYVFDMGENNDRRLPLALRYLQYLGTDSRNADSISRAFFRLGCQFDVSADDEQVYVMLTGLEGSFESALQLFEELLAKAKPDTDALHDLVDGELKSREDAKLDKGIILFEAMDNYAMYGPHNPFTDQLSASELKSLKPKELVDRIHGLNSYRHEILYYGPRNEEKLTLALKQFHRIPSVLRDYPQATTFVRRDMSEPVVYFTNYDMVQAEVLWLKKSEPFNKDVMPIASLFNEYYGGMGGVVFQDIRESRALAYSSFSAFDTPDKAGDPFYVTAYLGTQSDKLNEAMDGMNALLKTMPRADRTFTVARDGLKNKIETERITRSGILFNYLTAQKRRLDHDVRRDIYAGVERFTLDDIASFHQHYYADGNYAYCVIGSKENINLKNLERYGKVVEVSLKDVFGY